MAACSPWSPLGPSTEPLPHLEDCPEEVPAAGDPPTQAALPLLQREGGKGAQEGEGGGEGAAAAEQQGAEGGGEEEEDDAHQEDHLRAHAETDEVGGLRR